MSADEIITAIMAGDVDEAISGIEQAIHTRKRYLRDVLIAKNTAALTPGTRVVIVGNIKPKYFLGELGTVADRPAKSGCIEVDLDRQISGRYRQQLGMPANCLRQVDSGQTAL
jgi:hypothetical protein